MGGFFDTSWGFSGTVSTVGLMMLSMARCKNQYQWAAVQFTLTADVEI
jgi:hypothetical protein